MNYIFKKLNYKDQPCIVTENHPKSFDTALKEMKSLAIIVNSISKIKEIEFIIVFATKQKEIDDSIGKIFPILKGDAVIWYCYPKGSSKNYTCDFNRDTGWAVLGQYNLEPVRQVAIDEDWSALRFRKVEFIKTITRRESMALTAEAKKRTTQKSR
jgi:hypothetical protein